MIGTGGVLLPSVWKSKFYDAFVLNHIVVLHAIDATPARWHGDAGSSPLDGASTAASSPGDEFVKSTWDAAPRTEHAVLAAGEALEVAPAAHCRRADLFVVRARLRVAALLLANCTRC